MFIHGAALINLFFVPVFALYLHYRRGRRAMEPCFALLVQYCIAVPFNFVLAKLILILVNRVVFTVSTVDSAHYTIAALVAAWLLPKLYALSKQVRVEFAVKRLGQREKSGEKREVNGDEET